MNAVIAILALMAFILLLPIIGTVIDRVPDREFQRMEHRLFRIARTEAHPRLTERSSHHD